MFESRLSRALLLLGAAVGIGGVGVWALEMRINLPDWMVRVAMLKLSLAGSLGLLFAGALIGRHAKTRSLPEREPPALNEAMPTFFADPRESPNEEGMKGQPPGAPADRQGRAP